MIHIDCTLKVLRCCVERCINMGLFYVFYSNQKDRKAATRKLLDRSCGLGLSGIWVIYPSEDQLIHSGDLLENCIFNFSCILQASL